ncbi:glycosyltransferase family 2 protein [Terribacillus saccharophilus]|uniref:glycosyltransferase family 2 protein n=1 Tax=Terribacillus saccharophilus TaxID=361277 RepID=UPI003981EA5E
MKDYQITVIVPMYNVESHIEETINSITGQTMFETVEVLIVDDCSTDASWKLAERKRKKYPSNIRLIRQPKNVGVSTCRNLGLKNANGEYIFFADSDDILPHDALEKLYTAASRTGADLITAPFNQLINEEQEEASLTKIFPELKREGDIDIEKSPSIIFSIFCWGKLYKRTLIKEMSFHEDISFGEDQIFTITAMLRANHIFNIPDITYHYRMRLDSITKSATSTQALDSSIRVMKRVEESIDSSSLMQKSTLKSYYFRSSLIRDIWGPFRLALTAASLGERHQTLSLLNDWISGLPDQYIQNFIKDFNEIMKVTSEYFPGMDNKTQQLLVSILRTIKSKYGQPALN